MHDFPCSRDNHPIWYSLKCLPRANYTQIQGSSCCSCHIKAVLSVNQSKFYLKLYIVNQAFQGAYLNSYLSDISLYFFL
jgi:hypothetical protein